jgi:putative transposase
MTKDTVVAFRAPFGFSPDPLTALLRQGARQLIAQAVEAELNEFLPLMLIKPTVLVESGRSGTAICPNGRFRLGSAPCPLSVNALHWPAGPRVKVPRVRDRAPESERIKFTSTILPPYPLPGNRCLQR